MSIAKQLFAFFFCILLHRMLISGAFSPIHRLRDISRRKSVESVPLCGIVLFIAPPV